MNFLNEYLSKLFENYQKVIYKFDTTIENYKYIPLVHVSDTDWSDKMTNLLIKNLLNYCYYEKELQSDNFTDITRLEDYLAEATLERLNERLNESSDGLVGELLLDLMLREEYRNCNTLLCRPLFQQKEKLKKEFTGYDSLLLIEENDKLSLLLGQAKAGNYDYCKKGIKEDLNTKYGTTYFGKTMCYIKERQTQIVDNKKITELLTKINKICIDLLRFPVEKHNKICELIKEENVKLIFPCLLFYNNPSIYAQNMESLLNVELKKVISFFDELKFDINLYEYEIHFYIFPTINVSNIRNSLIDYKKDIFKYE